VLAAESLMDARGLVAGSKNGVSNLELYQVGKGLKNACEHLSEAFVLSHP
jgi:hypothetical protein